MTDQLPARLGLSQPFDCSYLAKRQEQLLVILEPSCYRDNKYEQLLGLGFRRSGDQIYRPHCPSCSACNSVRVLAEQFKLSKSQKRKSNKAKAKFTVRYSEQEADNYYPLYSKYISLRHQDGSMFPPERSQYNSFLFCKWLPITFIELWHDDKLIAVAVTDTLPDSLSAIYTFFDPDYDAYSLGTIMILEQIKYAQQQNKTYVYLGYQIDECVKMNYKTQYLPAEKQLNDHWVAI